MYSSPFKSNNDDQDYIQEISKNDGAHPKSNGYRKIAKIISQSENWWF